MVPCFGTNDCLNEMKEVYRYNFYKKNKKVQDIPDQFVFSELTTPAELELEGLDMYHCIGSDNYKESLFNGDIKVFSLRDSKNNPHVTIEVDAKSNSINEITGHGDSKIIHPRYHSAVHDFAKFINVNLDYKFYSVIPVIDMPDGSEMFVNNLTSEVIKQMQQSLDRVKFKGLESYMDDNASLRKLLGSENIEHLNLCSLSGLLIFIGLVKFIPQLNIGELDFKDNFIRTEGVLALVSSLKGNISVRRINLRRNHVMAAGAEALAKYLGMTNHTESINLSGNHIGNDGLIALSDGIIKNRSLKEIDLSENEIGHRNIYQILGIANLT